MFKGKYDTVNSHRQMIQDSYRTFSYKAAIESVVQENDIVIDYGAGSGILSIIAARSGAKKVYAIERNSKTAKTLMHNIKLNNLEDIIEVYEGDAESFIFFHGNISVDVIISECIGDHLFENKMVYEFLLLDNFFSPRDKIPYSMGLYYYPGCIEIKNRDFNKNLDKLGKDNIYLEIDNQLPELAFDVGYFEDYSDKLDPYFQLIDKIDHKNCVCVFNLETIEDIQTYICEDGRISKVIEISESTSFLLLYFYSFLTPEIHFHNHPSRASHQCHSYYQRIIPNTYSKKINILIELRYDKISNEDSACQNIEIIDYV